MLPKRRLQDFESFEREEDYQLRFMSFYREKILDHYRNPRNRKKLSQPDGHFHLDNPLCGDEVDVWAKVRNNVIKDIGFVATGCAISIAAASMLSELIKGKKITEVQKLGQKDIDTLLKIDLSPSRVKCALLGLTALKTCLKHNQKNSKRKLQK